MTTLPAGVFDGLTSLQRLRLYGNRLTTLPAGVFDDLASLQELDLRNNHLAGLTRNAPLFAGFSSEVVIRLEGQTDAPHSTQTVNICDRTPAVRDAILTALVADCAAVDSEALARVERLDIAAKQLTALRAGDFSGLTGLQELWLNDNQLTALPAGVFEGLTGLRGLSLYNNQLATLPAGVFNGLTALQRLWLHGNQLTALPAGVFDGLTGLQNLSLHSNQLTTLPAGVFDGLAGLRTLDLRSNHLVGLTRNDPLFEGFSSEVTVRLESQTEPPETTQPVRLAAAVPLMPASDSTRQGFVRIVNESGESGGVRVFAVDDGGHAPDPIEIQLGAGQTVHFNSNDLENGNPNKGVERGVGSPVQGDWRLDVATALSVRVMAFVRTTDGFLTAMHDVLPRVDGRLVAHTFNPGRNRNQVSKLHLVNTGGSAEGVSIEGVDDRGNNAGPVTLRLAARESRTLSALDLENGAQGLTGALGGGAGKWRLFVSAGDSVAGMSLLESVTGHLTNLSTAGVATGGDTQGRLAAAVPLMISASDSTRQGFVRIVNESGESGSVRVFAFDDGGYAPNPIEIQLDAGQVVHFNSNDLENGNPNKGVERGVGSPVQGDWRLDVETALSVRVMAFVRTTDGFLTAMHDVLPRGEDGRLVAHTFNPGRNTNQVSRLRFVNTGGSAEGVSIEGVDDQGNNAGPVTLMLEPNEARTLSALDLENGAHGLTGALGGGAGKWRLFISAGGSVVGMSLLESVTEHLTNLSTAGVALDP